LERDVPRLIGLLLLAILVGACGGEAQKPAPDETDEQLALLEALPYTDWDEEADPAASGIAHHDPERSWDGVNLYTNSAGEAYLMDMDGRRLHTWTFPEGSENCGYFELLGNGEIVATCKQQYLVRLDRDSNVIWSVELPVHHDVHPRDDGGFVVLTKEKRQEYKGRHVQFGGFAFVSPQGEIEESWSGWEHLEQLKPFHRVSRLETEPEAPTQKPRLFDYYHWNTVEVLPETELGSADSRFQQGNLLLCPRNVNSIVILDRDSLEPVWSWGQDELSMPHMPTMLENGNILIFDNGVNRRRSRILEIDPSTGEIVWKYPEQDVRAFFSFSRGSNQRLPNGNTLICASDRGHVFEITPDGERVWEFWNPERKKKGRKQIYRMLRMSRDEVVEKMRVGR
jgi:outer membrane protein assembly factor BamB